ncbi:MAG: TetR-like C-terminal domain-containing protein, partial [Patescibacteria group bacterium]
KDGYASLYAQVVEEVEKHTDSEGRITGIVMVFWSFSHTTPELYQLMYGMEGARATSEKARGYAQPLVVFVTKELIRFDPKRITADNVVTYMVEAWSMLHGMIALDISGYTAKYIADNQKLSELLTADVLHILRRQQT